MAQTKIFDRTAEQLHTFSLDSIFELLTSNPGWNKDKTYLKQIIKTRLDKGVIIETFENTYEFVGRAINDLGEINVNVPVLKYNQDIGITDEFQHILNSGVTIYPNYTNLVELSSENSNIIEDLIANDDRYKCEFSKKVFDSYCINGAFQRTRDSYLGVLRMIDLDNSTQVWKNYRNDFYNILNYITTHENDFYNRLENCDISLVNDLLSVCSYDLLSFCSKVCKFLNNWLFDGDGYYIYDYYVLNIIPYYLDYYRTNFGHQYLQLNIDASNINERNYNNFYDILSKINNLRNAEYSNTMTKHKLDHIMWYSYRSFKQSSRKINY